MLDGLSALVEGGIPQGTVTLLTGSPGTGKSTLAISLAAEHLARGGAVVCITTESSPKQLVERSDLIGSSLRPFVGDGLWFLDCYSWRAGARAIEPNVVPLSNLADLSGVSIAFGERLEDLTDGKRAILIVFDTPSTLTLHAPGGSILKLLELVFAKARSASGSVLVPVERDMHEPAFTATLSAMCDGQIDFRLVEENDDLVRQMRILSMRTARATSSKWTRLDLHKDGLRLNAVRSAAPPAV